MTVLARPQRPNRLAPREVVYSQDQQRERRRQWLRVHYRGDFDLTAEVAAIVNPLAAQVAALPRPLVLRPKIDEVADAVHELISTVVGMLAESRQLDSAAHARTVRAVRDLAQRPTAPLITDEHIGSGRWAAILVEFVAPFNGDLAALLGRALPPHHPKTNGLSASERLEAALRVLDTPAHDLAFLIPKAARRQSLPSIEEINAAYRAREEAERVQRALAKVKPAKPAKPGKTGKAATVGARR